jgi:hypothetical protein
MRKMVETPEERAERIRREAEVIAKAHADIDAGLGMSDDELEALLDKLDADPLSGQGGGRRRDSRASRDADPTHTKSWGGMEEPWISIRELVRAGREAKARDDFVIVRDAADETRLFEKMTGRTPKWLATR